MTHPSYFELDAFSLGEKSSSSAHIASCGACQSHLARITQPVAMPNFLRENKPRFNFRWLLVASALAVTTLPLLHFSSDTIRAKSLTTGSVTAFIKRNQKTQVFNPLMRIQPGDQLQFVVNPHGMNHVLVRSTGEKPETLYEGILTANAVEQTLPLSWTFDSTHEAMNLEVVLSQSSSSKNEVFPFQFYPSE